ncbi:MAG: ammonium transporter [Microthrixaceae bacterium]
MDTTLTLLAQEAAPDVAKVLLDNTFVFVAAVLVVLMQIGFALVEAGLTRAKSVSNIMMKNLMDFCGGAIMFFLIGYSFAYGPSGNGFIAWGNEALRATGEWTPADGGLSPGVDFFFQLAFAAAAATIVSGAMAERTKFKSYFIYSLVITGVIYPIVIHWFWGGGWLAEFNDGIFVDFAGSSLVHMTGGLAALAGAAVLGPRIGKYGPDGKPRAILGHNIPFAVVGAMILLIGWFGFNPGSQLAADFPEVGNIALTTTFAAVSGALLAMGVIWIKTGKPDVAMTANGLLAGLVGITAGTASVGNWGAIAIGAISGAVVVGAVLFFDRVRIDDPVGAISVHGICGGLERCWSGSSPRGRHPLRRRARPALHPGRRRRRHRSLRAGDQLRPLPRHQVHRRPPGQRGGGDRGARRPRARRTRLQRGHRPHQHHRSRCLHPAGTHDGRQLTPSVVGPPSRSTPQGRGTGEIRCPSFAPCAPEGLTTAASGYRTPRPLDRGRPPTVVRNRTHS